jgi:hypothetical protein
MNVFKPASDNSKDPSPSKYSIHYIILIHYYCNANNKYANHTTNETHVCVSREALVRYYTTPILTYECVHVVCLLYICSLKEMQETLEEIKHTEGQSLDMLEEQLIQSRKILASMDVSLASFVSYSAAIYILEKTTPGSMITSPLSCFSRYTLFL